MDDAFKVPSGTVRWLTDQAFQTRKRTVEIVVAKTVTFFNTFWFEGSKNEYRAVILQTGASAFLATGDSPWSAVAEGRTVELEPGVAIVQHVTFCGKDLGLRVWLHPDNVQGMLP